MKKENLMTPTIKLDEELAKLNQMLYQMANVVEKNIHDAIYHYAHLEDAAQACINDDIIDRFERLIEEMCLDIMIKEKLYAKDLRIVTGILKMTSDLERIGDHAEDIMEYNLKLLETPRVKVERIEKMASLAISMVDDSILCFVKEDIELAKEVIQRDDEVDQLYAEVQDELIADLENGIISPKFAIHTTFIVKYIERIADHAVNIAEWASYVKSGFYKDKKII
jgi:phosphate transport system protein